MLKAFLLRNASDSGAFPETSGPPRTEESRLPTASSISEPVKSMTDAEVEAPRLHYPLSHTHNKNGTKCCLLCRYGPGPSSLPLPPLCPSSVDSFCVLCGPHPGSGGSASPRRLSTHLPPSSLRVCASSCAALASGSYVFVF